MGLSNFVLLGVMVMLHLNINRAAPRPKGSEAEDKCREENNSLKKCMVERYRGWAGICNNERKIARKCVNEVEGNDGPVHRSRGRYHDRRPWGRYPDRRACVLLNS